jgi:hypothetical protein
MNVPWCRLTQRNKPCVFRNKLTAVRDHSTNGEQFHVVMIFQFIIMINAILNAVRFDSGHPWTVSAFPLSVTTKTLIVRNKRRALEFGYWKKTRWKHTKEAFLILISATDIFTSLDTSCSDRFGLVRALHDTAPTPLVTFVPSPRTRKGTTGTRTQQFTAVAGS